MKTLASRAQLLPGDLRPNATALVIREGAETGEKARQRPVTQLRQNFTWGTVVAAAIGAQSQDRRQKI